MQRSYLIALLFAIILSLRNSYPALAKLDADCIFAELTPSEHFGNKSSVIKLSSQLPTLRNPSQSCTLKTDNKSRILYLRAKRNKDSREGSLHLSVYGRDKTFLEGHLDIAKSAQREEWRGLLFCPSRSGDGSGEKQLMLSGTPGMRFTVEASQDQEVILDEPKQFNIDEGLPVNVFQFIPREDISKTQLDITVNTLDSDVPSYLKVSKICKDVKENIRLVDYKGESIRLTFAKKGRITLSKVSIPPLTDSTASWYIGIAFNNATGTIPLKASKTGTLTITKSFDYSYVWPMIFITLVPFFCGGLAALWALSCLIEPFVNPSTFSNKEVTGGELLCTMIEVIRKHWFARGPKTYSYVTGIVGFVFMIGAIQFVYADWYLMIQEGDRDRCYYNDFCYRVWKYDIPFNLMISNSAYLIHAFILAVSVLYMEAKLLAQCKKIDLPHSLSLTGTYQRLRDHPISPNTAPHLASMSVPEHRAEACKKEISFSIAYAFAWALLFEGLFSTLYHFCPTTLTFQFDSAFMFVISGLIVVVLYNGHADGNVGGHVEATNFFFGFIVPLYILNYLGALNHSREGLIPTWFWAAMLGVWGSIVAFWVCFKLNLKECGLTYKLCFFIFGMVAAGAILTVVVVIDSLPHALLLTCIVESVIVIFAKICQKIKCSEWVCEVTCKCLVWILMYELIALAFIVSALVVFFSFPTTDKAITPEKSRNKNHECTTLGFFDYHDLWHILSSFALLMGAYLVIYISQEPRTETNSNEPIYGTLPHVSGDTRPEQEDGRGIPNTAMELKST